MTGQAHDAAQQMSVAIFDCGDVVHKFPDLAFMP
jgi:hypothetical protein